MSLLKFAESADIAMENDLVMLRQQVAAVRFYMTQEENVTADTKEKILASLASLERYAAGIGAEATRLRGISKSLKEVVDIIER